MEALRRRFDRIYMHAQNVSYNVNGTVTFCMDYYDIVDNLSLAVRLLDCLFAYVVSQYYPSADSSTLSYPHNKRKLNKYIKDYPRVMERVQGVICVDIYEKLLQVENVSHHTLASAAPIANYDYIAYSGEPLDIHLDDGSTIICNKVNVSQRFVLCGHDLLRLYNDAREITKRLIELL